MKVTFSATHSVFAVKAPKDTLVSLSETPTQVADGVYKIGDNGVVLIDEQYQTDSIYLSTAGSDYTVAKGERIATVAEGVEVWAGSSGVSCPFVKNGKGGGGSSGGCTYKGTTTTAISNGSTTNPITIDGESYTAVFGDIVVYGYTEFVFDGTTWSEFGRPFDTTPTSGSANAVTSDGIYQRTPLYRSNNGGAQSGNGSTAYDAGSIAVGVYTRATASASAAFGNTTTASSTAMMAIGVANKPRHGDYFEIGNGTNSSNRSNILEANATSVNINSDIKRDGVGIDDYTTTERKIGKWIDGSDLYQRTFEVTGLSKNTWNNDVLGTTGIEIKEYTGNIYWLYNSNANVATSINSYRGTSEYCTAYIAPDKDDLNVLPYMSETGMSIDKAVITIKYTKPSVQANALNTNIQQTEEPTDEMR